MWTHFASITHEDDEDEEINNYDELKMKQHGISELRIMEIKTSHITDFFMSLICLDTTMQVPFILR